MEVTTPPESSLDQARRHVTDCGTRVTRQREIIVKLLQGRNDITAAMRLLDAMVQTHEAAQKRLTFEEAQYTASRERK